MMLFMSGFAEDKLTQAMSLDFASIIHGDGDLSLTGLKSSTYFDFQIKKNAYVQSAVLHLGFTPSPSLIPSQSHLKVSLNGEYMGLAEISSLSLGQKANATIELNPLYIKEFNQLKLEFVGQYEAVCATPASSALWLEISKNSHIDINLQMLASKNELSFFPEPFFIENSQEPLTLPIIFAKSPNLEQVRAGSIVSSLFGSFAKWRDANFPVLMNELPKNHAVLFASNDSKPSFLQEHTAFEGPTVEMIDSPVNPYYKILVIGGRDDADLILAATGLAQGNIMLRGQQVLLKEVKLLQKRKPYDAPNWVDTSKPVSFFRLLDYKEQLLTRGSDPKPVEISFQLPPDLYINNSVSIPVNLNYRYTQPQLPNSSFLNVMLNGQFVNGYELKKDDSVSAKLNKAFELQQTVGADQAFYLPASSLGLHNKLQFDFKYGLSYGGGNKDGQCVSTSLPEHQALVDGSSTLDLTHIQHYMQMPNLQSFIEAGFPFSRLADLSETWFILPENLTPTILTTVMKVAGRIGSLTGYPVLSLTLSQSWQDLGAKDVDVLYLGELPKGERDLKTQMFSLEDLQSSLKVPLTKDNGLDFLNGNGRAANTQSTMASKAPIAAIIGMQSRAHPKRSMVALLAEDEAAYELLLKSFSDPKWRTNIKGSVAVIRDSGVHSLDVGKHYYVGFLPWWLKTWYELKNYPITLAVLVIFALVTCSSILRRLLKFIGTQRIRHD